MSLSLFGGVDTPAPVGSFADPQAFWRAASAWFGHATAPCLHVAWIESPLGALITAATDDGIVMLDFNDDRRLKRQVGDLCRHLGQGAVLADNAHLQQLRAQLAQYFAGQRRAFDLPLIVPGSAFQQQVWSALGEIPYGQTRSYEDMATRIGRSSACRAVGTANGRNRISIVIPCHRVQNKSGGLGGYGGGLWRKSYLLDLERRVAARAQK